MRVIFMGTPDFAVGTLEEIIKAGHEVVLAVSQPDKAVGRSSALRHTPVTECALSHGIEVYQPARVRDAECVSYLRGFKPDIIIVVAFGQIITKEILDLPRYGCVNVHASLLPKYRGASPIQWAVINGESVTGVTTMRMDEGIDTGDMILKEEVPIRANDTGGSMFTRLSETGAALCVKTMAEIEAGTAVYTPQDHSQATHTAKIRKELGNIDWSKDAVSIERLIRGLNPWPSAYTDWEGKVMKIWEAQAEEGGNDKDAPGTVVSVEKDGFCVKTGDGILKVLSLQIPGKKRMEAEAFLRGYQIGVGTVLSQ